MSPQAQPSADYQDPQSGEERDRHWNALAITFLLISMSFLSWAFIEPANHTAAALGFISGFVGTGCAVLSYWAGEL